MGCGASSPKGELVRFVVGGAGLEVDSQAKRGGRGAYLHRHLDCFVKGSVSRRWGQALRSAGTELRVLECVRAAARQFGWTI